MRNTLEGNYIIYFGPPEQGCGLLHLLPRIVCQCLLPIVQAVFLGKRVCRLWPPERLRLPTEGSQENCWNKHSWRSNWGQVSYLLLSKGPLPLRMDLRFELLDPFEGQVVIFLHCCTWPISADIQPVPTIFTLTRMSVGQIWQYSTYRHLPSRLPVWATKCLPEHNLAGWCNSDVSFETKKQLCQKCSADFHGGYNCRPEVDATLQTF
jgi:hypothetical protein